MRLRLLVWFLGCGLLAGPLVAQDPPPLPAELQGADPSVIIQCRATEHALQYAPAASLQARARLLEEARYYAGQVSRMSLQDLLIEYNRLNRLIELSRGQFSRFSMVLSPEADAWRSSYRYLQGQRDLVIEANARAQVGLSIDPGNNGLLVQAESRWQWAVIGYNAALLVCVNDFETLNPGVLITRQADDGTDQLGRRWNEEENGWAGEWNRRGNSNIFDATWRNGGMEVRGTLTITISGNAVNVSRQNASDQNNCEYQGVLRGTQVRGTYTCTSGGGEWRATIE